MSTAKDIFDRKYEEYRDGDGMPAVPVEAREMIYEAMEEFANERMPPPRVGAHAIAIIELWNSKGNLIKCKKVTKEVNSIVTRAITKYSVDECAQAIGNYSEMLSSDYYMDYRWDIKKFFKQGNCAPDFFDNGVKWINFKNDRKGTKKRPISNAGDGVIGSIKFTAMALSKNNIGCDNKINYTGDDYDEEVLRRTLQMLSSVYPYYFCSVANDNGYYVDSPVKNEYKEAFQFKQEFNYIIIMSYGKEIDKIDMKTFTNK